MLVDTATATSTGTSTSTSTTSSESSQELIRQPFYVDLGADKTTTNEPVGMFVYMENLSSIIKYDADF